MVYNPGCHSEEDGFSVESSSLTFTHLADAFIQIEVDLCWAVGDAKIPTYNPQISIQKP